jgi:hypothetical protein
VWTWPNYAARTGHFSPTKMIDKLAHAKERLKRKERSESCMAEIPERKKRRMGERREADTKKPATPTTKWPLIKPKRNLQITHLKDTDLFTVRIPILLSSPSSSYYYYYYFFIF